MVNLWHKWLGQPLYVIRSRLGMGQAAHQQMGQEAESKETSWTGNIGKEAESRTVDQGAQRKEQKEQKIGQGKRIGVALGYGSGLLCSTSAKKAGPHCTRPSCCSVPTVIYGSDFLQLCDFLQSFTSLKNEQSYSSSPVLCTHFEHV